ncbi:MAG: hypothetical protein ACT4PP_07900 [Sporichthyaceae bacterium]
MFQVSRKSRAIVAAAAVLALAAPASAVAAKAPKHDSLKGEGSNPVATVTIDAANKGASPQSPATGTYAEKGSGFIDLRGAISCLHVSGNRAGLIYRAAQGSSPAPAAGRDIFIVIVDNGASGDKQGFLPPGLTPPGGGCNPSTLMGMEMNDLDGDFVIVDAA